MRASFRTGAGKTAASRMNTGLQVSLLRRIFYNHYITSGKDMFAVYKYLMFSFLLFAVEVSFAQAPSPLLSAASQAKDLDFPAEPSGISSSTPRMALYKPEGAGPFPALVLQHQCSGLGGD